MEPNANDATSWIFSTCARNLQVNTNDPTSKVRREFALHLVERVQVSLSLLVFIPNSERRVCTVWRKMLWSCIMWNVGSSVSDVWVIPGTEMKKIPASTALILTTLVLTASSRQSSYFMDVQHLNCWRVPLMCVLCKENRGMWLIFLSISGRLPNSGRCS